MATLMLVFGLYLLAGGCFIGWFRTRHPGRLRRLRDLKARFGDAQGNIVHFLAYVVLQIVVGAFLLVRGLGELGFI